ncbi:hypothetical protein PACILC2_19180 [Paenibacillus cisolokensis]|uniref:Sugar ABC transporter permease n=1 Tax=Paenibacillus cisolokensis TaxID=1658519 RepID=A0ABQ4N5A9_9BACL|nr:hypothetical protein [Paenibacillus cisolokensis]GIQ63350.1 hypothetical protein PACILC2_19180 [Paenibacillus cisolokensis]
MKRNGINGHALAGPVPLRIRFGKALFRYRWFYLMMVPGLLYYLIYHYVPMAGLMIAFKDYNLSKGIWGSEWVGFKHFETIFGSPDFTS